MFIYLAPLFNVSAKECDTYKCKQKIIDICEKGVCTNTFFELISFYEVILKQSYHSKQIWTNIRMQIFRNTFWVLAVNLDTKYKQKTYSMI